jgi:hypothetical protein
MDQFFVKILSFWKIRQPLTFFVNRMWRNGKNKLIFKLICKKKLNESFSSHQIIYEYQLRTLNIGWQIFQEPVFSG